MKMTMLGLKSVLVAVGAFVVFLVVVVCVSLVTDGPSDRAARALGVGAVCGLDDDLVVPCVKDGKAYQCVVRGDVACAEVPKL